MKSKYTLFTIVSIIFFAAQGYCQKASRLLYEIDKTYNGTTYAITDSVIYKYSGGRGQDKFGNWLFDTSYTFIYSSSGYTNSARTISTYDGHDNYLTITQQVWDVTSSNWQNSYTVINTYDVNNDLLINLVQDWNVSSSSWVNNNRIVNTYDAHYNLLTNIHEFWDATSSTWIGGYYFYAYVYDSHNNIDSETSHTWNSSKSIWDNRELWAFKYNSSNHITRELGQFWDTTRGWINLFLDTSRLDARGNAITDSDLGWNPYASSWYNYMYGIQTYNSANLITGALSEKWSTGKWVNNTHDTETYDAANRQLLYLSQVWDSSTSAWLDYLGSLDEYDAHGDDTTILFGGTGGVSIFHYSVKTASTYNTYHQRVTEIHTSWNDTTGSLQPNAGDQAFYYYYQLYTPPAGVASIESQNGSLKTYPSPANAKLNIQLKWEEEQTAIIAIYDLNGRLWEQWQTNKTADYQQEIVVTPLPVGNYILKIRGENEQLTGRFSVVH
ncbi:MAG TPA: T9SS type A sorting domain-containing protein [Flavipsychrobacter sp.]|nr:T9SS type A sorting domain-containing protein [Flavipsychrobacter sp.]